MARWLTFELILLLSIFAMTVVLSAPPQVPLQVEVTKPRKLRGRFLQITDLHPDPYYTNHASQSSACHRRKPKKEKQRSNLYGTPFSECDSPLILTNFTLDFLDKHWASELDFVIWTGDNARHDNDRKLPRTPSEIYELNRAVASKMEKTFGSKGIPVIPSLAHVSDICSHTHPLNPTSPLVGRTLWKRVRIASPANSHRERLQHRLASHPRYVLITVNRIWKSFIPFPMYQVFQRGGYFHVEVVPNALAVISLNTMYFYDSNKGTPRSTYSFSSSDGADSAILGSLTTLRRSNLASCGGVWVHGPGRSREPAIRLAGGAIDDVSGTEDAAVDLQLVAPSQVSGKAELYKDLIEEFSALPKKAKEVNYDNYGVINVSPPVVPNPYVPTFRVFSYNVSEHGEIQGKKRKHRHDRGKHGDKGASARRSHTRTAGSVI
ncbi:Endopolyphosphatase [Salix suchowensis]|nr:Endopolyphosphatase [Salix suchowensis]